MALFLFLIWILRLRLYFLWFFLAIVGLISGIISSLVVIFDNLAEYIDLAILDFMLLNLQLRQFKLFLKRLNVLVKLILEDMELIFKFLDETVEWKEHPIEVVDYPVDLNFHIGPQRLL